MPTVCERLSAKVQSTLMDVKDCKILIVDDVPTNVELLSAIVKTLQAKYEVAYSGVEALAKVDAFSPDIILLDLMMPDITGWKVIKEIRTKYSKKEMAIIVTSALTDHENISECYTLGIDDYVAKPILPSRIINSIMIHCEDL